MAMSNRERQKRYRERHKERMKRRYRKVREAGGTTTQALNARTYSEETFNLLLKQLKEEGKNDK